MTVKKWANCIYTDVLVVMGFGLNMGGKNETVFEISTPTQRLKKVVGEVIQLKGYNSVRLSP